MFEKLFGKGDGRKPGFETHEVVPPWGPEFTVSARGAMGTVRHLMIEALSKGRGVYAETLMTALGALAGFSAQHAILETYVRTGRLPLHGVGKDYDGGAFVVVGAGNPVRTYYFGDLLNSFLVPTTSGNSKLGPAHQHTLLALVSGACARCGVTPLMHEEVGPIFGNAAKATGTPEFGAYRLHPDNRPHMDARQALDYFWPGIHFILARKPPIDGVPALPPIHWPVALGMVTQELIVETKDVLSPGVSARLVMEAAIPMSKVDPASVPRD